MSLRTCLADGPLRFEMIEHVLAALIGLQVDNVLVRCTAAEMPGLDGSSYPLAAAIAAVGRCYRLGGGPRCVSIDLCGWVTIASGSALNGRQSVD